MRTIPGEMTVKAWSISFETNGSQNTLACEPGMLLDNPAYCLTGAELLKYQFDCDPCASHNRLSHHYRWFDFMSCSDIAFTLKQA